MAAGGAPAEGSFLAVMGDEDTITGFLLAGIGNVDLRKNSNFLIVNESKHQCSSAACISHVADLLLAYLMLRVQ